MAGAEQDMSGSGAGVLVLFNDSDAIDDDRVETLRVGFRHFQRVCCADGLGVAGFIDSERDDCSEFNYGASGLGLGKRRSKCEEVCCLRDGYF